VGQRRLHRWSREPNALTGFGNPLPCPDTWWALWTPMFGSGAKIPLPPGFIPPCLPSPSQLPPSGSAWVHEIKHDGYRLIARRDGNRVRLYTRRGYDWSDKYPRIVDSLLSLRVRSIIVDGEAVWAGKDGKSDFDTLHSNAHDDQVFLYGFDLLELNGEDYRQHSLEKRKAKLEKILARTQGMRFSEHIDGDGETIFRHACKMGLEGIFPTAMGEAKVG
jgi:bifunctional non-homologous end joining protein LigD